MATQYTITIESTQIVNGIEYTEAQLQQGLAQVRTQYNARTSESLTDAEWLQWSYLQNLAAWYEQNKGAEPVEPSPIEPVADWEGLKDLALSPFFPNTSILNPDSLYPIFDRVRNASFTSESTLGDVKRAQDTSTALGFITDAILTVKDEGALYKGLLDLKEKAFYDFTQEEKDAWQLAVDGLNFTPLVYLP